jgi:hypothetical protein
MSIANLVNQYITSSGVADLELGDAVSSFTTVASVFNNGDRVFYTVVDGNNREVGLGTYDAGLNVITRTGTNPLDVQFESIFNGIYTSTPAGPINLNEGAKVSVSPSIQALTTHLASWKRVYAIPTSTQYLNTPNQDLLINGLEIPRFPAGGSELSSGFTLPIGHDISPDTILYLAVEWLPRDNAVGDVRWGIEFTLVTLGSPIISTATIYVNQNTTGVVNEPLLAEFAPLTPITIPGPNTVMYGRVFRDIGNDTYTGDAGLIGISGAYQAEWLGTPSKNSDFYTWS